MNARKVIILIGVAGILLIIIVVSSFLGSSKKEIQPPLSPTQTPFISSSPKVTRVSPALKNDTQPVGGEKTDEEYMKVYTPDIYLANKTPFSGTTFSVTRSFQTKPNEHFAFVISSKEGAVSFQTDARAWMKSLGLTDSQIAALDIEYQ